jgi:putative aldouronate transport system permease protein
MNDSLTKRMWKYRERYLMLLPMVLLVLVFSYLPMYGITLAFKKYRIIDGIFGSPWVGLAQFQKLFHTASFWNVMKNTVEISGLRILFGFPAPILFALLLNEVSHRKYQRVVQTISYLPHFMSWVVLSGIIMQLFSINGVFNFLIQLFGGEHILFMTSTFWFRPILIITSIWQGVGWSSVIYLASIAGINPQIYEAATIDGANRFQMIRYITLASIYPVISMLFILQVGSILNAGFDQIFNLYNPLVYDVSDILDTYVYRKGFGADGSSADYSFSTAVGLFKNVIGFGLVILTNFVSKKMSDTGIW